MCNNTQPFELIRISNSVFYMELTTLDRIASWSKIIIMLESHRRLGYIQGKGPGLVLVEGPGRVERFERFENYRV